MLHIKVLGSGCPNCKKLEAETRAALDTAGIAYELAKVTDLDAIIGYGVMSTPALVINEQVVLSGRIPARAKLVELARAAEAE